MKKCRTCGSEDLRPYEAKPPTKHNGPCTEECTTLGTFCRNCRMFHPQKG